MVSIIRSKNNNPSPSNSPVFDVANVEPNASVILFRAPVTAGVIGTFAQVNSLPATVGGTVAIADLNNGQGTIADGSYVYEAQQIDLAGNAGPVTGISATVTIDTLAPLAPSAPILAPAFDTGVSNTDGISRITLTGFPNLNRVGSRGECHRAGSSGSPRAAVARSWSVPGSRRPARRRSPSRSSIRPLRRPTGSTSTRRSRSTRRATSAPIQRRVPR